MSLFVVGFEDSISYKEALGLSLCFEAYAEYTAGEYITEVGFNPNSGYVYIALEDGISICSMLGNEVEYLVLDPNDEEHFFGSYEDAQEHLSYF